MMKFFKIKLFEEAYCQQKKEQYTKIEKKLYTKNFYLGKNFESKYFFNSHIFSTKNISYGKKEMMTKLLR